jgi:hypothetical protein
VAILQTSRHCRKDKDSYQRARGCAGCFRFEPAQREAPSVWDFMAHVRHGDNPLMASDQRSHAVGADCPSDVVSDTGTAPAGGAVTALVPATSGRLASACRSELGGGAVVVAVRAIRAEQLSGIPDNSF